MNARSLSGINDVTSNGEVALTMNARSMSGINDTFGGGGDVFQAGNPNTFTGTNTFNNNRPTSTLETAPGLNEFITKRDGDSLFTNNTGDALLAGNPNTFTGTNTFNNNRPTSTLETAPGSNEFITKRDGDSLFTNNTGDALLAGNPNTFTGTNTFNNNRPISTLETAPGLNEFITKRDGDSLFTNNTGDAVLDAGSEASPQIFTGVNTFNSVNLKGSVFTENGAGTNVEPHRRTVLSKTFTTNNTGSKWIKIATLPNTYGSGTQDITKIVVTGGTWTGNPIIITAWLRNRGGFKKTFKIEGDIENNTTGFSTVYLFAQSIGASTEEVDVWICLNGVGTFAVAYWSIDSIDAIVYKNPVSQNSAPSTGAGVLRFSTDQVTSLQRPELITRGASDSFSATMTATSGFPSNTSIAQDAVFNANRIEFNHGGCYNYPSGKFTARIRGVYMFKFSAFSGENRSVVTRPTILKNGIHFQAAGRRMGNSGNQVFAIMILEIGDAVHIASTDGSLYFFNFYGYNQFSGSLLSAF